QTLDGFLERVHDEPEHAPHFAQEIPEELSDLLKRNYWRRDQGFFRRLLLFGFGHSTGKVALVTETEKRFLLAGAGLKCGLLVKKRGGICVGEIFFDLWNVRGRGIGPCPVWQDEFHERK